VTQGPRRVWPWLVGAGLALLLLCGVGLGALLWLSAAFGFEGRWTVESKPPAQFRVKSNATRFHFRASGFQDPYYELIFQVHDVARFLSDNALTRGEGVPPEDYSVLERAEPPRACTALEGLTDDQLYRSGQLCEWPDATYVRLVAFGT
jgi:hypothetical protein